MGLLMSPGEGSQTLTPKPGDSPPPVKCLSANGVDPNYRGRRAKPQPHQLTPPPLQWV